jgi:dihydropyrimidinase
VTSPRFDLVVRGGTLVMSGHREHAAIGVRDGRIAQLGGPMTGHEELRADGLLVIPGGIDPHVHLRHAALAAELGQRGPVWADDFWTGSLAALAGGITTVGNMTFARPGESMTAAVGREMAGARAEAAVDWFLHPVLTGLGAAEIAEVATLAADGHTSVKVFLSNPDFAAGTPALAEVVAAAGRAGSLTLVHCEDAEILRRTGREMIDSGRGAVRYFPDARPVAAEVTAVDDAIGLARETGAPVYVVHLSSAAALAQCAAARAAGLGVYVETRPLYLHLTRSRFAEPDAAKYVGAPPLRDQADRDALWRGLAAGEVDTLGSDHAPWTLEDKLDPALDVVTARQGVRRPGNPDADAVLRGGRAGAYLAGPVRGADLGPRGPAVRTLPAQGDNRSRLGRRSHAMGSERTPGHRRAADELAGGILGLRRLDRAGLAPVRHPPWAAGSGRRLLPGAARPGPVDPSRPGPCRPGPAPP